MIALRSYISPFYTTPAYQSDKGALGDGGLSAAIITAVLALGAATDWFGLTYDDKPRIEAYTRNALDNGWFGASHYGTNDHWYTMGNLHNLQICEINIVIHYLYYNWHQFYQDDHNGNLSGGEKRAAKRWMGIIESFISIAESRKNDLAAAWRQQGVDPELDIVQKCSTNPLPTDYVDQVLGSKNKISDNIQVASFIPGMSGGMLPIVAALAAIGGGYYMFKKLRS